MILHCCSNFRCNLLITISYKLQPGLFLFHFCFKLGARTITPGFTYRTKVESYFWWGVGNATTVLIACAACKGSTHETRTCVNLGRQCNSKDTQCSDDHQRWVHRFLRHAAAGQKGSTVFTGQASHYIWLIAACKLTFICCARSAD